MWSAGSYVSDQGSNLCPLHQEHRVLAIGLPGKSLRRHLESDLLLWFDSPLSSFHPCGRLPADCILKKKKSRHSSSLPQNRVPSLIEGACFKVSGEVESMWGVTLPVQW